MMKKGVFIFGFLFIFVILGFSGVLAAKVKGAGCADVNGNNINYAELGNFVLLEATGYTNEPFIEVVGEENRVVESVLASWSAQHNAYVGVWIPRIEDIDQGTIFRLRVNDETGTYSCLGIDYEPPEPPAQTTISLMAESVKQGESVTLKVENSNLLGSSACILREKGNYGATNVYISSLPSGTEPICFSTSSSTLTKTWDFSSGERVGDEYYFRLVKLLGLPYNPHYEEVDKAGFVKVRSSLAPTTYPKFHFEDSNGNIIHSIEKEPNKPIENLNLFYETSTSFPQKPDEVSIWYGHDFFDTGELLKFTGSEIQPVISGLYKVSFDLTEQMWSNARDDVLPLNALAQASTQGALPATGGNLEIILETTPITPELKWTRTFAGLGEDIILVLSNYVSSQNSVDVDLYEWDGLGSDDQIPGISLNRVEEHSIKNTFIGNWTTSHQGCGWTDLSCQYYAKLGEYDNIDDRLKVSKSTPPSTDPTIYWADETGNRFSPGQQVKVGRKVYAVVDGNHHLQSIDFKLKPSTELGPNSLQYQNPSLGGPFAEKSIRSFTIPEDWRGDKLAGEDLYFTFGGVQSDVIRIISGIILPTIKIPDSAAPGEIITINVTLPNSIYNRELSSYINDFMVGRNLTFSSHSGSLSLRSHILAYANLGDKVYFKGYTSDGLEIKSNILTVSTSPVTKNLYWADETGNRFSPGQEVEIKNLVYAVVEGNQQDKRINLTFDGTSFGQGRLDYQSSGLFEGKSTDDFYLTSNLAGKDFAFIFNGEQSDSIRIISGISPPGEPILYWADEVGNPIFSALVDQTIYLAIKNIPSEDLEDIEIRDYDYGPNPDELIKTISEETMIETAVLLPVGINGIPWTISQEDTIKCDEEGECEFYFKIGSYNNDKTEKRLIVRITTEPPVIPTISIPSKAKPGDEITITITNPEVMNDSLAVFLNGIFLINLNYTGESSLPYTISSNANIGDQYQIRGNSQGEEVNSSILIVSLDPATCEDDSQCSIGQFCNDSGICEDEIPCQSIGDCPEGQICSEDDICVPEGDDCVSNRQCLETETCEEGICILREGCIYNNPSCSAGYDCINNECVEEPTDEPILEWRYIKTGEKIVSAIAGEEVWLVAKNPISTQDEFKIYENEDLTQILALGTDDFVTIIEDSIQYDSVLKELAVSWTIPEGILGEEQEENYQLYFKMGEENEESEILTITPTGTICGNEICEPGENDLTCEEDCRGNPDPCDDIDFCSEYLTPSSCALDNCNTLKINLGAECKWQSSPTLCNEVTSVNGIGYCSHPSVPGKDTCEDNLLEYTWQNLWTWDNEGITNSAYTILSTQEKANYVRTGLRYYYDPTGEKVKCESGDTSAIIPCPAAAKLGFFDLQNLISATVLIFLIYFITNRKLKIKKQ